MRAERRRRAGWGAAALAAGLVWGPASLEAQSLTLSEALRRADARAYANRMAVGETVTRSAGQVAALQGILPTVRLEGGYLRTTDPIGAFGVAMRQRTIDPADFDPARLNHPEALSNHAAAVVVEQPLLNADAHLGRLAAARAARAGEAAELWTRYGTRVDVVRAYFGAVLAAERVATLEAAAEAARGHARQAEAMVRSGLATRSDALLASVKAGEMEAELIAARGDAAMARRRLAVVLGAPEDTALVLPASLPTAERIRGLEPSSGREGRVAERADVRAAEHGDAAAQADLRRAQSLLLPRINAFARYDWNDPDRLYAGDENWTVGVMATWTPFAGASQIAEIRAASGREASARAGVEAARAQAQLEAEQAANAWRVALARLEIAGRAVEQSREAHRIVTKKYEGGLATVLELLDAAAMETAAAMGYSRARYDGVVTAAERLLALGLDPAGIASIETNDDRTGR